MVTAVPACDGLALIEITRVFTALDIPQLGSRIDVKGGDVSLKASSIPPERMLIGAQFYENISYGTFASTTFAVEARASRNRIVAMSRHDDEFENSHQGHTAANAQEEVTGSPMLRQCRLTASSRADLNSLQRQSSLIKRNAMTAVSLHTGAKHLKSYGPKTGEFTAQRRRNAWFLSAWEAAALPLSYTRVAAENRGFREPAWLRHRPK